MRAVFLECHSFLAEAFDGWDALTVMIVGLRLNLSPRTTNQEKCYFVKVI